MKQKRTYSPEFKAKIALEAIDTNNEISHLAHKYNISVSKINEWRSKLVEYAPRIFNNECNGRKKPRAGSEGDVI